MRQHQTAEEICPRCYSLLIVRLPVDPADGIEAWQCTVCDHVFERFVTTPLVTHRTECDTPVKVFWRLGPLTCVLFIADGSHELKLLHGTEILHVEPCDSSGDAYSRSQTWHRDALRRTPN